MKKILGISLLLIAICTFTAIMNPNFLNAYNVQNTLRWTALYGVISIGVAFVIISGGIDLSIGSVVGLTGSLLVLLLTKHDVSVSLALLAVLVLSLAIGLLHGLLITKVGLQPFVVTLCGLLFYRGAARFLTNDQSLGYAQDFDGLRQLAIGSIPITEEFGIPYPLVVMLTIAVIAMILLNQTLFGRYLLALGRNEEAVRYSGINSDRVVITSYVICSLMAGLGGVLFSLDVNSVQPSGLGEFYELYAIAAAVLGGCSLRGGEGSILGVIIGAAVMRVLYNAINILHIPTHLEFSIIGVVILIGVSTDEIVRKIVAKRSAAKRT
ncbi:MAG TPA: ABC transporter permease [Candidatus Hydrogenedentes bacterium]|nr:ABC transporter permease [Candidatus Hydrogenedentota bacterium]